MMRLIMAAVVTLCPASVLAQTLDPQIRPLMHNHVVEPNHRVGVATWTIMPDLTNRNLTSRNPKRLLFVAGLLVRSKTASANREWWLEVMPGGLFEIETGKGKAAVHPLLNTRAYLKWPKADLYLENHLRKDRLLVSVFATRPFKLKRISGRWGIEGEAVVGLNPKVTNLMLLGPRLSVRLYFPWLSLAEVLFVDQNGKLVPRTYIKFGK